MLQTGHIIDLSLHFSEDGSRIFSAGLNYLMQFQKIWEGERKRYKTNLLKKRRKKIKFLKTKCQRKTRIIPEELDGIIYCDQTSRPAGFHPYKIKQDVPSRK